MKCEIAKVLEFRNKTIVKDYIGQFQFDQRFSSNRANVPFPVKLASVWNAFSRLSRRPRYFRYIRAYKYRILDRFETKLLQTLYIKSIIFKDLIL